MTVNADDLLRVHHGIQRPLCRILELQWACNCASGSSELHREAGRPWIEEDARRRQGRQVDALELPLSFFLTPGPQFTPFEGPQSNSQTCFRIIIATATSISSIAHMHNVTELQLTTVAAVAPRALVQVSYMRQLLSGCIKCAHGF